MSDHEQTRILIEHIEALCAELAPLAETYEKADSILTEDPNIRALRHSRAALSLSFIIPSPPHIAVAKASYQAALPILLESLPQIEHCHQRFTILESDCEGLLEESLGGSVELRSQVFRHLQRVGLMELLRLMGLIASLAGEVDTTLAYYSICLEQAKGDSIGTTEWADAISPFRSFRRAARHEREKGDLHLDSQ